MDAQDASAVVIVPAPGHTPGSVIVESLNSLGRDSAANDRHSRRADSAATVRSPPESTADCTARSARHEIDE